MRHVRTVLMSSAALLATALTVPPQQNASAATSCATSTPFTSGTGGYHTFRIPSVVKTGSTLLAMAEARRNSAADNGDIEVLGRQSTDNGCTWGPLRRLADNGQDVVGNPTAVVNRNGRIILLTVRQSGTVTSTDIAAGKVPAAQGRRVYVQYSDNAGASFSSPREITGTTKRSNWLWYATGPGHGILLSSGRLVIPANHSLPGRWSGDHLLLSDDGGTTWRIGAVDDHTDGVLQPDENSVAQLPDGRLYLNSRDEGGTDPTTRLFTYSLNNGSGFSTFYRPMPALVTPVVQGQLLQDLGTTCKPLLFSAPQDATERRNLTVRRSADGGRTWRTHVVITSGPSAYSDLVKLDRTTAGVLYETGTNGPYERIQFQRFTVTCPN